MTNNESPVTTTPLLSNRVYDVLTKLVQLAMPAFATLYLTLAPLWGFPKPEAVVATTAALATFFGVLLAISRRSYVSTGAKYSGAINIATSEDGDKAFTLELDGDPFELENMSDVSFRINTQLQPPTV
jgi:hypothetical protein